MKNYSYGDLPTMLIMVSVFLIMVVALLLVSYA